VLSVCVAAGEAGGSFRYQKPPLHSPAPPGSAADPERAAAEAARRARGKVRRYCAANRLNRLGTLTYRAAGCHDPLTLRSDLAEFFRKLRDALGGDPFAYLWVPEWHKTDHGLHAHFAVGQYVPRRVIEQAWPHGFVHIKLLGDLPVGSGPLAEARKAAGYLGKYVGKAFDERRVPGLHRYEVGQGFQPVIVQVWGRTDDEAIERADELMDGRRPEYRWSSAQDEGWQAPPSLWASWPG
jgi:hypothetical protein